MLVALGWMSTACSNWGKCCDGFGARRSSATCKQRCKTCHIPSVSWYGSGQTPVYEHLVDPCGLMAAYPHLCYVKMCCQRISCCQGICSCHQSDQSVPRHSKLQDEKNSREDSQNMVWLLTGITPRFSKWSQKSTSVCFLRGRAGFGINWTLWFFEGFSWGAPSCPAGERL